MDDKTASEQIDYILEKHSGWQGKLVAQLRHIIRETDPTATEEVKWKMRTRPEGLPVWSHSGMLCFVEFWKDNVKLLFPKGAHLQDPQKLFNARLKSSEIRAIEIREGAILPAKNNLQALVLEAARYNEAAQRK